MANQAKILPHVEPEPGGETGSEGQDLAGSWACLRPWGTPETPSSGGKQQLVGWPFLSSFLLVSSFSPLC